MSDELQVAISFKVERHQGLVILWEVGSNKLHLMRMGGPNGAYKMQTKTHHTYRTSEGAHAGVERWFALLDHVYEPTGVNAKQEARV